MNSPKVNVWCAMSNKQIIGPYFFEDETVNGRWIGRGGPISWAPRSPD